MVDIPGLRRSDRLKHSKKVDYNKSTVARYVHEPEHEPKPEPNHGKRKRDVTDDGDECALSREDTPVDATPKRRVKRKVCIKEDARQRAVKKSQNEGACIISGFKDKSIQHCHVLPRATKPHVLTPLEWWWGIEGGLNVDSSHNAAFLRADLHVLWDRGDIVVMPMPGVTKEYLRKWEDGGRHKVLEAIDENKIHEYWVTPHPDLVAGARPPPDNSPIRQEFSYRFDKVGIIRSHAKPHFMVLNAAMKFKEDKEIWVKALTAFCKRLNLEVNASGVVEDVLTLSGLWTTPPPRKAQLKMKQEAPNLPVMIPTREPMTPQRPKSLMGPRGLNQDTSSKLNAHKPEGEPCVSNLKSDAAQLALTGSRCLLSLQDDKSIQCWHVVARSTKSDTCRLLAAWWGLVDFDINSHFNILLLRADIHCLWDKGHLMFVPEPQIIDDYLEQDIVPIDGGLPLDELFEVSNAPLYRYCVVAHCDLLVTKRNAAFPRDFKPVGWVESRVPPQFFIYNAGLVLSKGGPNGFAKALDAFYKCHKVHYKAIGVLNGMTRLFRRWTADMPVDGSVQPASQDVSF